jgi:hypothetical protein
MCIEGLDASNELTAVAVVIFDIIKGLKISPTPMWECSWKMNGNG